VDLFQRILNANNAPEWAQAIGSVLAIVAGFGFVLYQHHLDRKAKHDEARQSEVHLVHMMVFQLRALAEEINAICERLAMLEHVPLRHFVLPGFTVLTPPLLPLDKLAFLLRSGNPELLGSLYRIWTHYEQWRFQVKQRADTYINEVQPRIKEQHVKTGIDPTPTEKEQIAGPVLSKMLKNATDYVYQSTAALDHLLQFTSPQLELALRKMYPESLLFASWLDKNKFVP
jgi:hypothetical protein